MTVILIVIRRKEHRQECSHQLSGIIYLFQTNYLEENPNDTEDINSNEENKVIFCAVEWWSKVQIGRGMGYYF